MTSRAALFLQAIRGPILLITLGLLFAAHQAGIISFARTWPLIIIVFGIMKLFERMLIGSNQPIISQPTPGAPPPGGYPR
jgi:LiaI-LiaF-like transmembrane region